LKRVDKILLSLFIGPLILTFIIADFVFLMQFLFKYIDDMVGKGIELSLILKLIGLFSITMVPMALPLAILLASNMTLGGLGERSELVAMKTAGISLYRIIGGLSVFILLLSISAFFFSNNILPWTNLQFYALLHDIRKHKPALDIEEGVFYNGINGFTFKIGEKGEDNKTIYDIIVYDHTSANGNDNVLLAEKGELLMTMDGKYLIMTLYEGRQFKDVKQRTIKDGKRMYERIEMDFKEFRKVFDLSEFAMSKTDANLWKDNYHMLNAQQLMIRNDTINNEIKHYVKKVKDYSQTLISINSDTKLNEALTEYDEWKTYNLDSLNVDCVLSAPTTMEVKLAALENARNVKSYSESMSRQIESKNRAIAFNSMMIHKKFTLAVACLVLFLIGAPMGAIVKKGGFGMPILVSIAFFILFYILSITGEKLVKQMVWSPAKGMWFPIVMLLPVGLFLTYKAARDSKIIDVTLFKNSFRYLKTLSNRNNKTA
jgi:lipopolysaccharide export system permease protein